MNTSEADRMPTSWTQIIASLEAQRLRIHAEITAYPMPIPACDAHFNHLLEQRARICEALRQARIAADAQCMAKLK